MASASTAPLPIFYNNDVHNFYLKQKQEFHFTQKSDNEFLMFLLDTAVRVISIVQHLAPVIEAVSDAGIEVDDIEDDVSPIHTPNNTSNISAGAMDVDSVDPTPSALSAELEQINQEITNAQISSQQLSRQPSVFTRRPAPLPAPAPISIPVSVPVSASNSSESEPIMLSIAQPTAMLSVSQPTAMLSIAQPPAHHIPSISANRSDSNRSDSLAPNVPLIQLPSSAQSSENTTTSLPSASQPVAEPPEDSLANVKTEQPVPEVIEIKEEVDDQAGPASESSELISQDTLDQLMSSISGAEDSVGLQNFVPTATPSGLPPSFLDRGAGNPLSMLGSLNSGDGPGPSGINVPNISESMMKNISDAGLNVSSIKGQANPNIDSCNYCTGVPIKVEQVEVETSAHLSKRSETAKPDQDLATSSKTSDNGSLPPHKLRKRNKPCETNEVSHFSCSFCDVNFRSHELLRRHLMDDKAHASKTSASYDQLSVFSCQVCHISFLSEACLREHNEAIHRVKIKRVFHCSVCPSWGDQKVTFQTLQGLRKHTMSQHYNSATHAHMCKCGICCLKFDSVPSLEVHLKSTRHHDYYEGVGPYSCNICPQKKCASFSTAYLLKLHFKQAHSLQWHAVVPLQIPPTAHIPAPACSVKKALKITCIFCKAEFGSRELLKEHERTHLLGLPKDS